MAITGACRSGAERITTQTSEGDSELERPRRGIAYTGPLIDSSSYSYALVGVMPPAGIDSRHVRVCDPIQ